MGNKDKCKTKDCENKCEKRKKFCVKCHAKRTTVKCWNCDKDHPGVGPFCPYCKEPNSGRVKEATPSTASDVIASKLKRPLKEDVDTLTQPLPKRKLECSASGDYSLSQDCNRPTQGQPRTISETSTNGRHKNKPTEEDHNKVDASRDSLEATTSTVMPNSLSQDSNRPTQGQPGTISEISTNGRHKNKPSEEDHNKVDASRDSVEATTSTVMPNSLSQESNRPTQGQPGTISEISTNGRHKNKPSEEDRNKVDASRDSVEATTSTVMPNSLSQESNRPTQGQTRTISETSTNGRHKNKPSEEDHNKVDASRDSVEATTSTVMPNSLSQDSNRPTQGPPGTISETSTNGRHKPSEEDPNKVDASSDSVEATTSNVMPNSLSQGSNRTTHGQPRTISETSTNGRHKNKPSEQDHNKVDASRDSVEATTSTVMPNSLSQDSNRSTQGPPGTISETSTNGRHKPSEEDHNKVDASSDSVEATTSNVMPNNLSQDSNRTTHGQPRTISETSTNGRHKNKPSEEDHNKVDASRDSVEATTSNVMPNSLSQDSNRTTHGQPGTLSGNKRHTNKISEEDASRNLMEASSTMLPNESHKPSKDSSGKQSNIISADGQLTADKKDEMHSTPVVVSNTTIVIQPKELVPSASLNGDTVNNDKFALDCSSKDGSDFAIEYNDVIYEENYGTEFSSEWQITHQRKSTELYQGQVFGASAHNPKSVGHTFSVKQSSPSERESCVQVPESKQATRDTSSSNASKSTTEEGSGTTSENSTKAEYDTLKQQESTKYNPSSSGGKESVATSEDITPNQNSNVIQSGNNHLQNPDQLMDTREDGPSIKCENKANSANPSSYAEVAGSASQLPLKDVPGECDNRRGNTVLTRGNSKGKKNPDHVGNVKTLSALTDGKDEDKMTVCFHTVVTPEFNFNAKTDTIVMRFSIDGLGKFQKDVVNMEVERTESNYVFVKGELKLKPYYFLSKNNRYKYLLKRCIRGQQQPTYTWEFIDKNPHSSGHVDRLLQIPKEACRKQETFYHYDSALHVETPVKNENILQITKSFLNKVIRKVLKTDHTADKDMKLRKDHEIAMQSYLPQWEGFVCHHDNQNVTREGAVKAFNKLCLITEQMSDSLVTIANGSAEKWKPGNFSMKEVLQNYFDEKLDEISNNGKNNDESSISQQLISALAIAMVDEKYPFLEYATRHKLLRALVLPSGLKKAGYENVIRDIRKEFSSRMMSMVTKALETLCNNAMSSTKMDLTFLLVLPILHFLRGDSSPMEWPENLDQFGFQHDCWWGHETLKVKSLRMQNIDQNHEFLPILVEIESLFQVDHLLQRSFLATVRFKALADILKQIKFDFPVACSVVGLSIIRQKHLYSFEDKLKLMLSVLVKNAQEENSACAQRCDEKWHQHQSINVTGVLLNIFPELVNKTKDNQLVLHYLRLLPEALRNVEVHCGIESHSTQATLDSITQEASRKVIQYLRSHIHVITSSHCLEILNGFFNITFANKKVNDTWISCLSKFLLQKLEMESPESIIRFYCNAKDPYHPEINRVVTNKAFKAIDQVMMNRHMSWDFFSLWDGMHFPGRVGYLLSSFINKSLSSQTMTLKKCLTWPPLSGFFKMSDINFLDTTAMTNITRAKSVVEDIICRLFNGEITVEELCIIQQHEDDFLTLSEVVDLQGITNLYCQLEKDTNIKGIVLEILRCRQKELRVFEDIRHRVGILITFCSRMQHEFANSGTKELAVDISETTTEFETDVSQVQLLKLCNLIPVEVAIFYPSSVDPVITFFKLPDNVSNMLRKMEKIHNSGIFQQFWNKRADVVLNMHSKDSLIALEVVEAQVWRFVKAEWDQLKEQLVSGSISLYGVDNKLGKIMDDRLEDDLRVFEEDDPTQNDWIKKRCDQVRLYRQLKKCLQSATVILEIKKEFGLKGDFRSVELLCSTSKEEFKNKCLRDLNEDVETACRELKNVTEEQIKCLQTLINCKDVILWIKKEIKNMPELKVFVDLAMIQAGETPMEVHRVSCLYQAATGYSAFIFHLTKASGYKHLMTICGCTWKALENDPDLSVKLEDISREMEWVKGIKDSHGSVEVSSLQQVERINAKGIYEIGKLKEGSLRLRVPEEGRRRKEMIYTVEQIKDLQSKLMLIAGEAFQCTDAKKEIDRFVEVFDGAQNLEKYYQKMCRSGNVLFTNLEIALHCKISTKTPVYIDFCVTDQESLFGSNEKLTDILKELINFMKISLKQWYDYIDEKREEFYYLNVYTTKQLVILRHALASFGEEDVGPEVYALLSLVKPDCTVQDLRKAVTEVEKEKENETNVDETYERNNDQIGNSFLDEEKEHMAAFWDEMDDMMDEEQAMAVLEEKGLINVEEAVTFISESPYSKETLDDLVAKFITRVGCTLSELGQNYEEETEREGQIENVVIDEQKYQEQIRLQNRGHGTDSVKKDLLHKMKRFEGTLIEKLNHVWEKYLSSTKSADLTDYVSVETLGRLLKHLATPDCQATVRSFPQLLKRGRPNLIVCPASNVLHTVLSVYMEGNGSLPAYDEVLLCSSQTSLEEVELLWRRAFNGNNVKNYCLVNADALDFDVSVDAVKRLHELMKGKSGYKLVIVCNEEREDQSHVVRALNSDRISSDKQTCRKSQEIQDYLCMQFIQQVQLTNGRLQLAARLTNDRTCVQCISSNRPGVGKSLLIQRYKEQLQRGRHLDCCITVPLQTTTVQEHDVANTLISQIQEMNRRFPRIVHLDVSPNVCKGLDHLLFNVLILNTICGEDGLVWRRNFYDLYLVEITKPGKARVEGAKVERKSRKNTFLESLPTVLCRPPKETLIIEDKQSKQEIPRFHDPLMDDQEFRSSRFQRPYQYLAGLHRNTDLDAFKFSSDRVYGNHVDCLKVLLWYCGLPDPSWSELSHFACFLDKQLEACEGSVFCDPEMLADTGLMGFKTFVVKFMLQMSKDFATPSLQMSDESSRIDVNQEDGENLQPFQLRRCWENSPHPYIFFNHDHVTMTFMGFSIDRNGTLFDVDGQVLQQNMMKKSLMGGLKLQNVNLEEDFDSLPRDQKLQKLCMVMGIENVSNPDETYELTTDNVKKILAIHMRFRCGIPVIVMGETGCGKTRLIRFMCQLHSNGLVVDEPVNNMILMKVHGGTSSEYIVGRVHKAVELAQENKTKHNIDTVLFFDEANTTEAIGIIKEIMCDGRMNGQQIDFNGSGLKIVAACNPYKRHTKEMIQRLEAAGLGYHIKASQTTDRLGRIPLRRLVYRVQALPPSMLPLVWDFGQLNSTVEMMYIRQIVQRYFEKSTGSQFIKVLSNILSTAQAFMRKQKNECSFVSLRDVERTLNVLVWFFNKRKMLRRIKKGSVTVEESVEEENVEEEIDSEEDDDAADEIVYEAMDREINDLTWAMILALGVCYHARLDEKREEFRNAVAESFGDPLNLYGGSGRIYREINSCQDIFLDAIKLRPNIARNMALKENVFMMIICIELRIPLFLVGKPGSSKSLAKTIVDNAMQGDSAASPLFKELKQVHMVSYQCSPLSTPDGIVGTFRQCSTFQIGKNLKKFVSVVILDEVGLAEDSPKMPLKTLHPLLEYGSEEDDKPPPHKKVGFIGISNWALDPAKMNRGILVSRGVPKDEELIESARGICESETSHLVSNILKPLAEGYLQIYQNQDHEFFGLRDFYSLIKMVNQFAQNSGKEPTWAEIEHAVRRNFGGLESEDHIKTFEKKLESYVRKEKCDRDPDCSPSGLIKASLYAQGKTNSEEKKKVGHRTSNEDSRYLLVLTEKFAALPILMNMVGDAIYIYGSSFPFDQEYTQVCRNINRIKHCMEAGKTVVLLNLENLYESLYDALNQYYVYFGGQRYVDLGLGSHRVKCHVHESFRLVVVADKEVVVELKRFPIPLINRLEKHFLAMTTMLSEKQLRVVERLKDWVTLFTTIKQQRHLKTTKKTDAFVGYHGDTIAALVYQTSSSEDENEVFEKVKYQLLTCATPESVTRLIKTDMPDDEREAVMNTYFRVQKHGCLADYLADKIQRNHCEEATGILGQVTTYSRLLTEQDSEVLAESTKVDYSHISMISLQEFQHEQQFTLKVQRFFDENRAHERLLLVQCDASSDNSNLISCACYQVQTEKADRENASSKQGNRRDLMLYQMESRAHVVFIIQLPRVNRCFDGFQGGLWSSTHIDDLQPPKENRPDVYELMDRKMSDLFTVSKKENQPGFLPSDVKGKMVKEHNDGEVKNEDVIHEDTTLVDFTAVLLDSIHPATARIIDPTNQRHRSTERVCLLVELLKKDSSQLEFLHCLKQHILKLVKEKENRSYEASHWLTREALDIKEVQESGTFRQACWQRLTATIAPLLAEVIAVCDISNNLSLLESQEGDKAWLHQLWLNIFSSADLINISSDLSPVHGVQRCEVPVLGKGYGGKCFKASFPFSWIIKAKLDDIWKFSSEAKVGAETSHIQQFLRNVKSEIGQILQAAIMTGGAEKVVHCYCSDFINMSCKISQQEEQKLICDHLMNASYSIAQELEGQVDSVVYVAAVHLAFNKLQKRFEHFSQLIDFYPDVLYSKPDEEGLYTEEMTVGLDVSSLKYVLRRIDCKDFKSQDGQRTWLNNIHKLCPVVQSMIGLYNKNKDDFGPKSQKILEECRCLWSRITVMKLFFEHVCLPNEDFAKIVSRKCRAIWMALKTTADFKSDTSVNILVNNLNEVNRKAGEIYYKSGIHKCGICQESIEDPVVLPCKSKHVVCKECIEDYFRSKQAKKCPMCKFEFPQDFECEVQSEVSEVVAKHNAFRQCCNSFFMEVVSQLCFSDGTPPSKEVIKRLLGYVTLESKKKSKRVTRKVSPFPEDCIDPNPVVRSFLLQLLLQSNLETVKEHVQEYLKKSRDLLEGSAEDVLSLCTLFVNCLEDTYHSGFPQDSKQIHMLIDDAHGKLNNAGLFFKRQKFLKDPLSVELLEVISQIRFALSTLADITQCQQQDEERYSTINIKRLVNMLAMEARTVCQQNKQAQLYLVKYICRAYGRDALTRLKDDKQLNWILPDELNVQDQCIPDNCVIIGETYINIREAIGQCMVDKDFEKMFRAVKDVQGQKKDKEACLLLALFREITMNAATVVEAKRISLELKIKFGEVIQKIPFLTNKAVADTLLQNRMQNHRHVLRVNPEMHLLDYSIQAAVTHLQIVLNVVKQKSLTQCLAILMRKPSQMQQAYLPAMPQDDRMEAKAALYQATRKTDHNLTWYECARGHLYTIGNCGKPNDTGQCPECNLPIGARNRGNYEIQEGNKLANMVDTTSTGHVLGNPRRQHGKQIVCERKMNCMETAVVRFLLHASMLLGTECQDGPQPIINIIKPTPANVLEFLWKHLHNDVRLLSASTGKSKDDCIFILHIVIDNILHKKVQANFQSGFQQLLPSKKCRSTWEVKFIAVYIKPALQGLDEMIVQSYRTLVSDKRLSNDPVMRLLHTANPVEPEDLGKLVETSHVWQYRSRITIQCIHQALASEEDGASFPVLRLFMEKEKHLRVVQHLPDIIRLQRLLINKYNRHIDSAEAIDLKISTFLDQLQLAPEREEFEKLIDTFIDVWNSVRHDVALTVKLQIPKECYSEVMSYKSNIAMLLPTRRESGLCATGLVDFLIFTQNEFLERYYRIKNSQMSRASVSPSDLLPSHLIAYDIDRDLFPLILSQCQYIVRPMAGNKIEYNLQGLELQLVERFVRGRAFIDRKFDQLFFRQSVRNASIFKILREKLPQIELASAVQRSIVTELKSFQNLCKSLASLDIAIGFLANYKADGNMLIKNYLQDKLAMPVYKGLRSSTASQQCRLKHILALWQVLAVEKALRLTIDAQDPFDDIGEDYQKKLNGQQRKDLIDQLKYIKVDLLCAELFEYIVLNLSHQSTNTEDRTKWPILDTLESYYASKNENGEIPGLEHFPNALLLSHAVDTWRTIAQFHNKQPLQD